MNIKQVKKYYKQYNNNKRAFMSMLQGKHYIANENNTKLYLYDGLYGAKEIEKIIIIADDLK